MRIIATISVMLFAVPAFAGQFALEYSFNRSELARGEAVSTGLMEFETQEEVFFNKDLCVSVKGFAGYTVVADLLLDDWGRDNDYYRQIIFHPKKNGWVTACWTDVPREIDNNVDITLAVSVAPIDNARARKRARIRFDGEWNQLLEDLFGQNEGD